MVKRRDPNEQLEFLLTELVRLQVRVYNNRFRGTGLSQSQVGALIHLERTDQLSQSDLARRLGMKKAAAGTLVEGLEGKGLVERSRHRDDRRVLLVSITEAGRRIVEDVDHMAEQLGIDYRQGISREERAQFVATLQRLRANLRVMERAR